jgi:hypothetical protein
MEKRAFGALISYFFFEVFVLATGTSAFTRWGLDFPKLPLLILPLLDLISPFPIGAKLQN